MHSFSKLSVLTIAALATTASALASGHPHLNRFSYGYKNESSSLHALQLTTSTIFSTFTDTITKCPEIVTDCPASMKKTITVESVVIVSTTVCPVTAATSSTPALTSAPFSASAAAVGSSARSTAGVTDSDSTAVGLKSLSTDLNSSASSIVDAQTSVARVADVTSTAAELTSSASSPANVASLTHVVNNVVLYPTPLTSLTTKVFDSTLTYTIGRGNSTTAITTTIHKTSIVTLTQYVTATRLSPIGPGSSSAIVESSKSIKTPETNSAVSEVSGSITITIRSTSVFTRVVTVYPTPPSKDSTQTLGSASGPSSSAGAPFTSGAIPSNGAIPSSNAPPSSNAAAHSSNTAAIGVSSSAVANVGVAEAICTCPTTASASTIYLTLAQQTVTETVSVSAHPASSVASIHSVIPVQSSSSVYYPTGPYSSHSYGGAAPTGFVTYRQQGGHGF